MKYLKTKKNLKYINTLRKIIFKNRAKTYRASGTQCFKINT